mgnify:FL=1|jgi:hypothetical protein
MVLHPADDVATALRPLSAGEVVQIQGQNQTTSVQALEDIALCHKLALRPLAAGQPVRKYGEVIGFTLQAVAAGGHVHIHNLKSGRAQITS